MDIRRHLIGGLLAGAVIAPAMVQADAPAPKWYDKVTVGGYAAGDYEFWLNQPAAFGATTVPGRAFDGVANAFDYTGELTLAYADTASGTSANIDLLYGALGKGINGANVGIATTIGQGYLSQAWGPLTLDLGKFATPVGYEVWNVTSDANFSRSLTYNLEPLFSVGAKLDYAGPGGFGANLWVDNGQNIDPYGTVATDDGKGLGLALSYSGIKSLALNAQYYNFDSAQIAANTDTTDIDVNAAYTLSDSLSFAAEYFYTTTISGIANTLSSKTNSLALYATYVTPVKNLTVSGRAEQVNSPDAALNTRVTDSYTVTAKYAMGPVTDILEYRADAQNGYNYLTSNGTPTQVDNTVTIAATYGF
jgi:hypothetical protein